MTQLSVVIPVYNEAATIGYYGPTYEEGKRSNGEMGLGHLSISSNTERAGRNGAPAVMLIVGLRKKKT
jgi:hypothetical protein